MPDQADNSKKNHPRARRMLAVMAVLALLAAGLGVWLTRGRGTDTAKPILPTADRPAEAARVVRTPVAEPTVVDLNLEQTDAALNGDMAQRKAEYGVQESIDFIVQPDESLRIGGLTVPMSEILDKIRLETGDIIESGVDQEEQIRARRQRLRELAALEARHQVLEGESGAPPPQDPGRPRTLDGERSRMDETVALFKRYKAALADLKEVRRGLNQGQGDADAQASARARLYTLKQEIEDLERRLGLPHIPEPHAEAYGIYVVRPHDNIWNIHFRFLKEYFKHRGLVMPPKADEPHAGGLSSGVGRILKFSESMVVIYNLRERRLDVNLDLLQPRSKIVIFNMGEILKRLDPIDAAVVDRIRFDGETLWIPSDS